MLITTGYLIIQHTQVEDAFELGDEQFIAGVAKFCASSLGNLRKEKNKQAIDSIRDFSVSEHEDRQELYKKAAVALEETYGVRSLGIYLLNKKIDNLDLVYSTDYPSGKITFIDNTEKSLSSLKEKALDIAAGELANTKLENGKNIKNFSAEYEGKRFFIAPMRVDRRNIGVFIMPAQKIGEFSAQNIDDLSDALALKINAYFRADRYRTLSDFGEIIATTKSEKITKYDIIELAFEHISKAMYAENFYIALYDNNKKVISFPKAIKHGKVWDKIQGTEREINEALLGKTEDIILNKPFLLHKTKTQAIEWYAEENHKDHADSPLASWVGVRVLSPDGVLGVIAVYHDELDYIYSGRHVFFLQMVANLISGLFGKLELAESNKKLDSAHNLILDREQKLISTSFLQDMSHRLNNSLGSVVANLDESLSDIRKSIENNDSSLLNFPENALTESLKVLEQLIVDTKVNQKPEPEKISLHPLMKSIISQVILEQRIDSDIFSIDVKSSATTILTYQHNIYHLLFILIENAAEAIKEKLDKKYYEAFIKINAYRIDNSLIIDITDNGEPLPKNIDIFQLGTSTKGVEGGYGLWRARIIAASLSGELSSINDSNQDEKTFRLTFKDKAIINPPRRSLALIVEDEESWVNLISRWVQDLNYDVISVKCKEDVISTINRLEKDIEIVFLDISLNRKDVTNTEGLFLINLFKERYPNIKIIIITGYKDKANSHIDKVDIIIEKVEDGKPLKRSIFIDKISHVISNRD